MIQRLRLLTALVVVLAAGPAALAGMDIFLKLEGDGRVVATAPVAGDGSFRFDNVPDGNYFVEFELNGQSYSTATSPAGRTTSETSPAESIRVITAREAGSGLATGRRMHKPMTITKEWGPSTPQLMLSVEGSTVKGGISTSRSNIRN